MEACSILGLVAAECHRFRKKGMKKRVVNRLHESLGHRNLEGTGPCC